MEKQEIYDLIIVGAGPAGLAAGVYAARYLLKTLIIGEVEGGTILEASEICNFPSYKSITGGELAKKLIEHVKSLGLKIKSEKVEKIDKNEKNLFEIKTSSSIYLAKKIILTIGRKKQKLNVEGEEKFIGKGVSYCATCDAAFFKDKIVAVVGGSNSALTAALLLSRYAKKVYIIYRKEKFFRAEPAWIKQVEATKNIESVFNSNIKEIKGSDKVEKIVLDTAKEISVDGVFVEIGLIPETKLTKQLGLEIDENGYITTNEFQETSCSGVFAAGDITANHLKQIITACAEGAIAATSVYNQIEEENGRVREN